MSLFPTSRYPLLQTLNLTLKAEEKRLRSILDDDFAGFAVALIESFENNEAPAFCYDASLAPSAEDSLVMNWIDSVGVRVNRNKKRLLMPARLALTGSTTGIDISRQLKILQCALDAGVGADYVIPVCERMNQLKEWAVNGDTFVADDDGNSLATYVSPKGLDLKTFSKLRKVYEANRRTAEDDSRMYEILKAAFDQM